MTFTQNSSQRNQGLQSIQGVQGDSSLTTETLMTVKDLCKSLARVAERDLSKVEAFTLVGEHVGLVKRVIDGDTVDCALFPTTADDDVDQSVHVGAHVWRIRLLGIDTCELHPKLNIENRDEHVRMANASKDILERLVNGRVVFARVTEADKYQRWVGQLFVRTDETCDDDYQRWTNVSAHMLANAPGCVPYYGGNKAKARVGADA